ncbi:MAG: tRNA (5-methylaminomethyl-2-thiouridine)(34)-methyltransferase MnmD [Saprospiraceae bacterium]|nr:tRNA (5-methylaminomethyl-2-thiouridine)(34)-methyltransferase MnmD [Saprospiraceae bacterium]
MNSIFETKDGSHSIESEKFGVPYHSRHGAITESMHVFIANGFQEAIADKTELRILEIGFGSGLNTLLTALEAEKLPVRVSYIALEAFPCSDQLLSELNYPDQIENPIAAEYFSRIHQFSWDEPAPLSDHFLLKKKHIDFLAFEPKDKFDLIYLDAFAPTAQPELWTKETLGTYFEWMNPGGILTTYCAKGQVRRDFQSHGGQVERLPGPPGKREMLRIKRP